MATPPQQPFEPPWAINTLDSILSYVKAIYADQKAEKQELEKMNLRLNNLQQAMNALMNVVQAEGATEVKIQAAVDALAVALALTSQQVQQILTILTATPPPPQLAGITVVVTENARSTSKENSMAVKKAVSASVAVILQDDGTNLVSVTFVDTDNLPVTAAQLNGTWPAAVALPSLAFADATPGPSAYAPTAISPPAVSTADAGGFDVFRVATVQPIVPGSGQGVDATLTIATGLPTAPYSADAGTWTITSDPNALGGTSVVVT